MSTFIWVVFVLVIIAWLVYLPIYLIKHFIAGGIKIYKTLNDNHQISRFSKK